MVQDATYVVKYNPGMMASRWELLEASALGGYRLLERYETKEDAVVDATKLARRENVKAAFYSKDNEANERITATRDFR